MSSWWTKFIIHDNQTYESCTEIFKYEQNDNQKRYQVALISLHRKFYVKTADLNSVSLDQLLFNCIHCNALYVHRKKANTDSIFNPEIYM
jgi:hypothetical protein